MQIICAFCGIDSEKGDGNPQNLEKICLFDLWE